MMFRQSTFRGLSDARLTAMLDDGEPRERIWAARELALRHGEAATGELTRRLHSEPEGGVKRHWSVILASYAEVDVLALMARRDSNARVRGTAIQYLWRFARQNHHVYVLLHELLREASPVVRGAVVLYAPTGVLADRPALAEAMGALAHAPERYVRWCVRKRARWDDELGLLLRRSLPDEPPPVAPAGPSDGYPVLLRDARRYFGSD